MKKFLIAVILIAASGNSFASDNLHKLKTEPNLFPKYRGMIERTKENIPLPVFEEKWYLNSVPQQVNDYVNNLIKYKNEKPGDDYWQSPNETIELGTGDCEDYVILKKAILLKNGYTEKQLLILDGEYKTTGGETIYHSILRVEDKEGNFKYLDNENEWVQDELPITIHYGINNIGVYGR